MTVENEWSTDSCFFPPSALFFHLQKALPPLLPTSISLRCTSSLSLAGWALPNIEIPAPVLQIDGFSKALDVLWETKKGLPFTPRYSIPLIQIPSKHRSGKEEAEQLHWPA
ncbi:hypothetical protein KFK09_013357 [Dendrobium nobile]|uniref:Uncharacterized protein n=1 Tax=Dendrobium nobile TaxID=94219 RepID=A0A8T3B8L3_DENNO|nr:hypothetical protein KFK09_013357 [Dendrobium nobile]